MHKPFSLPQVTLLCAALCFGWLFWMDRTPVRSLDGPLSPLDLPAVHPTSEQQSQVQSSQAQSIQEVGAPVPIFQLTNERLGPAGSDPAGFTLFNDVLYFGLGSELGGLWQTDGTAAGTKLVKDIQLVPGTLQRVDDMLYFGVNDYSGGSFYESPTGSLWKSDGTTDGTMLIQDGLTLMTEPFVMLDDILYFAAFDHTHGVELWRTDGTTEGTYVVVDAAPGVEWLNPKSLVRSGDLFYFLGQSQPGYFTLWQSDGTANGTKRMQTAPEFVASLTSFQDSIYYGVQNQNGRTELWRLGDTDSEPMLLLDVEAALGMTTPRQFLPFQNHLFFTVTDRIFGHTLWRTDGTFNGTKMVRDIDPDGQNELLTNFVVMNEQFYFLARPTNGRTALWRSDGTEEGTHAVRSLPAHWELTIDHTLTVAGETLYLALFQENWQYQLWRSDGTEEGTTRVTNPANPVGSRLAYIGRDDTIVMTIYNAESGSQLSRTDGTEAGTQLVRGLNRNHVGPIYELTTATDDSFYFLVRNEERNQQQLWRTDRVGRNRLPVGDPTFAVAAQGVGDQLFLARFDDEAQAGLWLYDEATADLSFIRHFGQLHLQNGVTAVDVSAQYLFFYANEDGGDQYALWRSDGTANGTMPLVPDVYIYGGPHVVRDGQIVIAREQELWLTDGTSEGTSHFIPAGILGNIKWLTANDAGIYFVAPGAEKGSIPVDVLWQSDGTQAGTAIVGRADGIPVSGSVVAVRDRGILYVGERDEWRGLWYMEQGDGNVIQLFQLRDQESGFQNFTVVGDKLFFHFYQRGVIPQLWVSDGTVAGTKEVKQIVPEQFAYAPYAYPGPLFAFQDRLYFGAEDGVHGGELWQSDGSTEGTILFKDIHAGAGSSVPSQFIQWGDYFYFTANDGLHGMEWWRSDGTVAGTMLVADLYPGISSSHPVFVLKHDESFYFLADNGKDGRQFYNLYTGSTFDLFTDELTEQLYLPTIRR